MRIIIKSIYAEIIEPYVWGSDEDPFIIDRWIVEYDVIFSKPADDETPLDSKRYRLDIISGKFSCAVFPDIKDVLAFLKERYGKIILKERYGKIK